MRHLVSCDHLLKLMRLKMIAFFQKGAQEDAPVNEDKMQCTEVEEHEECVDFKVIRVKSSKSDHDK